MHNIPVVFRDRNRWRHEISGPVEAFAAAKDFATGVSDRSACCFDLIDGRWIDDRSHQGIFLKRVADAHLGIGVYERLLKFIESRALHQHAACCCTPLACGADRPEYDGRNGELEIRVFVDNDRVISAKFEQNLAHAASDARTDLSSDRARTRERQQVDTRVVDKLLRQLVALIVNQEKCRRQVFGGERRIDNLLYRNTAQCGFGRWLPNVYVAADSRDAGVPGPDRDREIESGDGSNNSQRMPLLVHAMLGPLRVHRVAIQHA